MAQFYKRGKGWTARMQWTDDKGKRHTKSKSAFRTKALAQRWASENQVQLNNGIAIDHDVALCDYFHRWITTYKKDKVATITYKRYLYTEKALQDFFGNQKLKTIKRSNYQEFINQYGATHAPETVHKVNAIIRSCIKSAILDDLCHKDFTQRVELTANHNKEQNVDYLNLTEIQKLVVATKQGLQPGFTSRYMILTAIYTGMRLSEIQALTWKDIDFLHATISINKSWDMFTRNFKPTKNKSSKRIIKVNRELLDILRQLRQHTQSNMVFLNQYGTIPTSNAVNKTLRSLLSNLSIHRRGFHFHSLRHSHVALLLANGIDIYAISKRLGHSSTATTSKIYAYLIDEYKDETDKQITKALSSL